MEPLQRPAKSAAEIGALPPLGTTQCSAHVREHAQSYSSETCVYLMREAIRLRDTALFEMAAKILIGRPVGDSRWEGGHCERTIAKLARAYGFQANRELRLAFRSRCLTALSEAIYAGREIKPFWEERFGVAFKAACVDAARSLSLGRNRDMEAAVTDDGDNVVDVDDFVPELPLIDAAVVERLSEPHHEQVLLQAVRSLPPRQARAVLLLLEERPIEGQGDHTVAAIMGITPRAVYKLLEKALATLRANPAIRAIWFGEA